MAYDPEALDGLRMEQDLTGATDAELANEIFSQNAARAALKITHLAFNSANEQLQYRAATYITDRVLGPVKSAGLKGDDQKDALAEFVKGIVNNNA